MGRPANVPQLRWDEKRAQWRLRFTHEGVRHDYRLSSLSKRDHVAASKWAAERQAAVFSGAWRAELERGTNPTATLRDAAAAYLAEVSGGAITERTAELRKGHLRVHLIPVFPTLESVTEDSLTSYQNNRLKQVRYATIQKEFGTLTGVLKFAVRKGWLTALPKFPGRPGKSEGTHHKLGAKGFTPGFTAEMGRQVMAALPERMRQDRKTGIRWPLRAYISFLIETGLRPGTAAGLRKGKHWRSGEAVLRITGDIDKNKFAREVPLSPVAVAALESVTAQADGQLFRAKDVRDVLRSVARKLRLPEEIAERIKPYDLRHARITEFANSGSLLGAGYLAGHKQATTTNRYSHANVDQARALVAELASRSGADSGADSGAGHKAAEARSCDRAPEAALFSCAKERTRTSTGVTPLAPQASASAIPPPSQGVRARQMGPFGDREGRRPRPVVKARDDPRAPEKCAPRAADFGCLPRPSARGTFGVRGVASRDRCPCPLELVAGNA